MKKFVLALVIIVLSFLAGIIFKMPNLFPIVVGIPFAIAILVLGFQQKIILGVLTLFLGIFVITGGMSFQTKMADSFQIKKVSASTGGVFIVDAQNVDYPTPHSPKTEAKSAEAANSGQPIAEANSGNCEFYGRYPAKVESWCALIEAKANEYGMDPLLIASLILVESGGQAQPGSTVQIIDGVEYHTSSSGAVGLMQVMPSDGMSAGFQCINGPCFSNRPTTAQLIDPTFNVDYGVRMLAGLVEKRGDIREALKSYGPNPEDLYAIYGSYYWYADKILGIRNDL